MDESRVLARLRRTTTHPAARGLTDDVAQLGDLIITHDSIAEGIHYLPDDPPASVGWKLMAVNLSDLAAKGAEPIGALLSLTLRGDDDWEMGFIDGVEAAAETYGMPLIGGDTIALPEGAPRVLGLTAIGRSAAPAPSRSGARPGDALWVVGTLGDSAAGLALLHRDKHASGTLVDVYRRPIPLLCAGRALAPFARASMDVSDGLLLDAERMAKASGCAVTVDLATLPTSDAFAAAQGRDVEALLFAATGGDDYALLIALPPELDPFTLSLPSGRG
ncbi:thiamine-phosphate kinase [Sphingomonas piscis]|uniref:thiamine-phosphate kinase n=1 Tax=Sphingomonas piscis TaxID=2714943 RepID=UPI001FE63A21|nr:thiamine-phosphate kinase [Sphingomonas piscis]